MSRNRAEGWTYAKLSGHENEDLVVDYINKHKKLISHKFGKKGINSVESGGLTEKHVESVLNDSTKSKTDLVISWDDNTTSNISIKKSRRGQVYLIGVERFIEGFEKQFNCSIPENVKLALSLFFGSSEEINSILESPLYLPKDISEQKWRKYEKIKNRLTWTTLKKYDKGIADNLITWFKENIGNISDFCFSKGLARNRRDWANLIWYINKLDKETIDKFFSIVDVNLACENNIDKIIPGPMNGGTTIVLPFGFVQWHKGKMQFHHKYKSIRECINE